MCVCVCGIVQKDFDILFLTRVSLEFLFCSILASNIKLPKREIGLCLSVCVCAIVIVW